MTTSSASEADVDVQGLIDRLAQRAGSETPLLLLRLEIEFLTSVTQALVANLIEFDKVRSQFLAKRLAELVEELSKPKLVMPHE